jgi:hypothetical protein
MDYVRPHKDFALVGLRHRFLDEIDVLIFQRADRPRFEQRMAIDFRRLPGSTIPDTSLAQPRLTVA